MWKNDPSHVKILCRLHFLIELIFFKKKVVPIELTKRQIIRAIMAGRLQTFILLMFPYAGIAGLIQYCKKNKEYSMNDQLVITPLQRKALLVHFWYFIGIPIQMEIFQDLPGIEYLVGQPPPPSNAHFMLTCLAAENFFVTSTALGMILLQSSAPRWALMAPFAQLAWNLKNHIAWFFLGNHFAPEGALPFALLDILIIWPIVAVYAHHFVSAKKIEKIS